MEARRDRQRRRAREDATSRNRDQCINFPQLLARSFAIANADVARGPTSKGSSSIRNAPSATAVRSANRDARTSKRVYDNGTECRGTMCFEISSSPLPFFSSVRAIRSAYAVFSYRVYTAALSGQNEEEVYQGPLLSRGGGWGNARYTGNPGVPGYGGRDVIERERRAGMRRYECVNAPLLTATRFVGGTVSPSPPGRPAGRPFLRRFGATIVRRCRSFFQLRGRSVFSPF